MTSFPVRKSKTHAAEVMNQFSQAQTDKKTCFSSLLVHAAAKTLFLSLIFLS